MTPSQSNPDVLESTAQAAPNGRFRRMLDFQVLLWRHCFRQMRLHNSLAMGAALSYRTIFALVPAIVLAFLMLKATGIVEDSKQSLRQTLDTAGLTQIQMNVGDEGTLEQPVETVNLADRICSLVDGIEKKMTFARLGPIGLILLAWSAITLLTVMERSLNRIFNAPSSRPLLIRVLLYWSAITFVPIVLVAIGFVGAAAMQAARQAPVVGSAFIIIELAANLAMGALLLACVYKFLPNTRVSFRSALIGAAVVVPLWILARWGFGLYVSKIVGKGSVYGALGLLPLFLLWVNFCWYAFLAGAELAYTISHLNRLVVAKATEKILLGPMDMLAAAAVVSGSFVRSEGPVPFSRIADQLALAEEPVRRLIDRLLLGKVVCAVSATDNDAYIPARPVDIIGVDEILRLSETDESGAISRQMDARVVQALTQVRERTKDALGNLTLGELVRQRHGNRDVLNDEVIAVASKSLRSN